MVSSIMVARMVLTLPMEFDSIATTLNEKLPMTHETYIARFEQGLKNPLSLDAVQHAMKNNCLLQYADGMGEECLYGRLFNLFESGALTVSRFFMEYMQANVALSYMARIIENKAWVDGSEGCISILVKDGERYEDRVFFEFDFYSVDHTMHPKKLADLIVAEWRENA